MLLAVVLMMVSSSTATSSPTTTVVMVVLSFLPLLFVQFLHGTELLLQLHPAVLEPDLDLAFREAQGMGYFDTPSTGQVVVEVELLL